jgi:hypothetical protein
MLWLMNNCLIIIFYVPELIHHSHSSLFMQIHHQISVSRSHIREVFERKFDHIFEDIEFPSRTIPSDSGRLRQQAVQHLRLSNRFIYTRNDEGKFVNPFTSDYIKRSLYFLLFGKKPRFANLLESGQNINHHIIVVICTFVSILSTNIFDICVEVYPNSSDLYFL